MLSEDLVFVLPRCVAGTRGRTIGPSHSELREMMARAAVPVPVSAGGEKLGKEALVRQALSSTLHEDVAACEAFVKLYVAGVRAHGGFSPTDDNFVGADVVERLRAAFQREGWALDHDGSLRPQVLDELSGRDLTEALRAYVRRAQRGADDAELVIGTSKCLEEAVARHVLAEVSGGYSTTTDFVSTLFMAFDRLGLAAPKSTDLLDEDPYRELMLAIYYTARAVNRLRNDRGDGHGRPTPAVATALEARLSASAAALVSELLLTALEDRS